jgi:hypothetical protein
MLQAASCEVADALTNKIVGNLPFFPLRCIHRQQKTSIADDFHGTVLLCHISALDCT